MVWWSSRPFGYKLGFFGLSIGTLTYVVSYAIPYWAMLNLRQFGLQDQTLGLWQACAVRTGTCVSNLHGSNPPWLNASRAMCTLSVVTLVVALFCGHYRNFTRLGQERCQNAGRHVESLGIVGCLLGLSGAVVFAYQFQQEYGHVLRRSSHLNDIDPDPRFDLGHDLDLDLELGHLHWGYPLVCSALGLLGLSSCLMLLFNRQRHLPGATRTTSTSTSSPAGVGYCRDHRVHIPYMGDVWPSQLVPGSGPVLPPSYDVATSGSAAAAAGGVGEVGGVGLGGYTGGAVAGVGTYPGYALPPGDLSDAPPMYEDIDKDCIVLRALSQHSHLQSGLASGLGSRSGSGSGLGLGSGLGSNLRPGGERSLGGDAVDEDDVNNNNNNNDNNDNGCEGGGGNNNDDCGGGGDGGGDDGGGCGGGGDDDGDSSDGGGGDDGGGCGGGGCNGRGDKVK